MQLFSLRATMYKHFIFISILLFSHATLPLGSLSYVAGMWSNASQIGAIAGTSSYSSEELCHFISKEKDCKGLRILEVGGGQGEVSEFIVRHMLPQDSLDIIEIDADFCVQINKKVAGQDNVSVHCCSILDWKPKRNMILLFQRCRLMHFLMTFFLRYMTIFVN